MMLNEAERVNRRRRVRAYAVLPLAAFLGALLLAGQVTYATNPVRAAGTDVGLSVVWGDSTALARWGSTSGAAHYRATLIRTRDNAIMEQTTVPASQHATDLQGIWAGETYAAAVEALSASGAVLAVQVSAPGQAVPISRSTYNGFLDTENVARGQVDTNLWDVRLGQDNPPNQGGTFVNGQMHYHIEAGNVGGEQTFTSMRARVPLDLSGGRTATIHGEVDLKGDTFNWFAATLTPLDVNGDHIIDQVDRPLQTQAMPQLELFTDQNGLHLFFASPAGGVELGSPYVGGYHTNNVRDEIVWAVSQSHVKVLVDGATAFDVALPSPLGMTHAYLTLMAENYPGNTGGIVTPSACDARMQDCNIWHLDSWGFDAPNTPTVGVAMPQMRVGYDPACGAPKSAEEQIITFDACGEVSNVAGSFYPGNGDATTTVTMPNDTTSVTSAALTFDARNVAGQHNILASLNGGPFSPLTDISQERCLCAFQTYRLVMPSANVKPGVNTITWRFGSNAPGQVDIGNVQLEAQLRAPFTPPAEPPQPAPLGTWTGGGTGGGGTPTPTPSPTQPPTPAPSPTPSPVSISNVPCTVTIGGVQKTGTCSGTFTPSK